MSLLNVHELAFRHSDEYLFQDASFQVNPEDRIGVVGPNGAGKTTLLRILGGELSPERGSTARRNGLRIAYLRQEGNRLAELDQRRRALEEAGTIAEYEAALSAFDELGGYAAEAALDRVLDGLGFDARDRELPRDLWSSGQRARAGLAECLLSGSDLLLLDEPTNHLDIAAREWLEQHLARPAAACVFVSHDREFLERAANRILEIRRGEVAIYEGGYDAYRGQRALADRQAWERYDAQQRRTAAAEQAAERRRKLSDKVATAPRGVKSSRDFYMAKAARLARTARILEERVTHEPAAAKPWEEESIPTLDFSHVPRTGDIALSIAGLAKSYDGKTLFDGLTIHVARGSRWAILGPNGSGKTTLLRILLGQETADSGEARLGAHARIGYYAQEGENLDGSLTPLDILRDVCEDETRARTLLGCLKLRRDRAHQIIATMSAGERGKVALARLLLSGANILLLDEPTNHLELEAQEAMEATLAQFPGTILFVSHDRRFIGALAGHRVTLGPAAAPDCVSPSAQCQPA